MKMKKEEKWNGPYLQKKGLPWRETFFSELGGMNSSKEDKKKKKMKKKGKSKKSKKKKKNVGLLEQMKEVRTDVGSSLAYRHKSYYMV